MTSAHKFHADPTDRRRSTSHDPAEILQEISVLVRESTSPIQQSVIADELGAVPEELKRRLEAVKQKEENDRLYGEFLTTDRVLKLLNLKHRQGLNGRLERHTILRVKTADGRNAYPALQFESGQVLPALKPVLQVLLPAAATEWTVLDWLVHPHPEFDGDRPIDRAIDGDSDEVRAVAEKDASDWSA